MYMLTCDKLVKRQPGNINTRQRDYRHMTPQKTTTVPSTWYLGRHVVLNHSNCRNLNRRKNPPAALTCLECSSNLAGNALHDSSILIYLSSVGIVRWISETELFSPVLYWPGVQSALLLWPYCYELTTVVNVCLVLLHSTREHCYFFCLNFVITTPSLGPKDIWVLWWGEG